MRRNSVRKTPPKTPEKRRGKVLPPAPTPLDALPAPSHVGDWKKVEEAREKCKELWAYCIQHPYETEAFTEYKMAIEAQCEALRDYDPEYYEKVMARKRELDAVYPQQSGFFQAIQQLRIGDARALEVPVQFLEADPWAFGTGYTKEYLIRLINRLEIPAEYARRLQKIVLAVIDKADGRREFRSYCRLARKVDSPELRQELQKRIEGANKDVRRCAQWVLTACQQRG